MIGIDITRISRFEKMALLPKFLKRFNVDGDTALAAAKTWACLEALYKAEGGGVAPNQVRVIFPKNSAPKIVDYKHTLKYNYTMTLSHEDDLVVAVALGSKE
jgi:phosphopantetheinyl transferase (holo-ACP synthase)